MTYYALSMLMVPGHGTFALPRFRELNHYYCVNAGCYVAHTYVADTA